MEHEPNIIEPEYTFALIKNYLILSELMQSRVALTIEKSKLIDMGFDIYARTHTEIIKGRPFACVKEFSIKEKPLKFPASYEIVDLSFYK